MNQPAKALPTTIEQAVNRLISELSFTEKSRIERMDERDLMDLYFTHSVDIEDKFRIFENETLLESCRTLSGDKDFFAEEASLIIIVELWKRLQKLRKERDVKR